MHMAFADPPYPGQAWRHYQCAEVDHLELVNRLVRDYPDGWALSTNSTTLRDVLPLCPPDVRVAAWVKPFCSFKPGVNPAYAWEPLIWRGGRRRTRQEPTVRDWVSCPITLKRGVAGAKPEAFCWWLFDLLGLQAGDTLDDLFYGSGAVTRAWERYVEREQGLLVALPLFETHTTQSQRREGLQRIDDALREEETG